MARFEVSDQLIAIARGNPGITLTDADVKKINANQLVLVGLGSLTLGFGRITPTGCIDHMFYGSGSNDLDRIRIDGTSYGPTNIKDFREILEKAAFHMKCINFCFDKTDNTMRMLNVFPQCCCECEQKME